MSRTRKTIILILTAVFFFTVGFFIFLQSSQQFLSDEPLQLEESVPLAYEPEEEPLTNLQPEFSKESETVVEPEEELILPQVEIANLPPISTAEEIEQSVRESMQRELNFAWEEHQRYMGILGDYVAVFRGEPGIGGVLIEETDIPIAKLPDFEVHNLRQGIAFSTEEEKYSILEGLHFPK